MKLLDSNVGFRIAASAVLLLSTVTYAAEKDSSSTDPCAAIAGKTTASFQEAKACLDHFPFNKDFADQTIDTVRKVTNNLYVFNVCIHDMKLSCFSNVYSRKSLLHHPVLKVLKSFLSTYPMVLILSRIKSGSLIENSKMQLLYFWIKCKMPTW